MSKRKKANKVKKEKIQEENTPQKISGNPIYPILVFIFAFLLYSNTIGHEYTQDDAIVIYDNMYTEKGFSGISGHLSNDTFRGFFKTEGKDKLVSGGRYRPLTPIMFSIENALFGKGPLVKHIISIFLYALLSFLIYKLLVLMLLPVIGSQKGFYIFVFMASLLFATHPLHTEAVANIKGRDEIMSLMGAVLALYYAIKYIDQSRTQYLVYIGIAFFLGLMAKETTITFLAVLPLAAYYFRNSDFKKIKNPALVALLSTIVFLSIRTYVLGIDFGGTPKELMNNPFIKIVGNSYVPFGFGEKFATIIFTLGKYLTLLIFPHPLTHDYYPRHIDIMSFGDWRVIISLLIYLGMAAYALLNIKKRSIVTFCILYFFITISIVSNIVFPIGTNMSERFMFMPSFGFSLLIAYLLHRYLRKINPTVMMGLFCLIIIGYSIKTFSRNQVWKNDFTLFTTDVKTSSNSAKVLNAAGGALLTECIKPENANRKKQMVNEAIPYLSKALQIHPNYKNAALLLGNAHYYNGNFESADRKSVV